MVRSRATNASASPNDVVVLHDDVDPQGKKNKQNSSLAMRNKALFFAVLVCGAYSCKLFSSPFSNAKPATATATAAAIAGGNTVALVECTVISPNSKLSTAANGVIQIMLHRDVSPKACQAFLDLVNLKYYDGVFLFRVVKGFVAQWGINPNFKWTKDNSQMKRSREEITDVVLPNNKSLSNTRGTLTFVPPLQVFINCGDNSRLDKEGARPFATITDANMELVVDKLYTDYKGGSGQVTTLKKGRKAIAETFPEMSQIETCRTVDSFSSVLLNS